MQFTRGGLSGYLAKGAENGGFPRYFRILGGCWILSGRTGQDTAIPGVLFLFSVGQKQNKRGALLPQSGTSYSQR
jgi:hypothetical protein